MDNNIHLPGPEETGARDGRRGLFIFLAIALTGCGAAMMGTALGNSWFDIIQWFLFVVLMGHIATGFSLALLGFFREISGSLEILEPAAPAEGGESLPATAILVPVYNEDMADVFPRIRIMWESLAQSGAGESFDFYILSDSNNAERWAAEMDGWLDLVSSLKASGRLFYRRRSNNAGHKSGNIADFCRRWGSHYRYMVVLDADSLLTGELMANLVRAMERRPRAGIIQTVPQLIGGESLYRRSMQFAASLYGRIFVKGCAYWQMDAANYWGHNAIIRIAAFMQYCALPDLPETSEKPRNILSHDTVEAALMRKAGYEVWLLPNTTGSYEESPPNLSEALVRDRRWCQGNFQHVWFLFAPGLDFSNRIHMAFGLMSYLSSPLWLAFLLIGVYSVWMRTAYPLENTEGTVSLLPLFFFTLVLLFLPKVLATVASLRKASSYGGIFSLLAGVGLETVCSALFAPVIMLFHSFFVFEVLTGKKANWNAQNRSEADLSWASCFRTYGWITLLGVGSILVLFFNLPEALPWLSPILLSWSLAIPVARWTSLRKVGLGLRDKKILLIPEEGAPPAELVRLSELVSHGARDVSVLSGFQKILLDPGSLALHLSFLHSNEPAEQGKASVPELAEKCFRQGPGALDAEEKKSLLSDAQSVVALHERLGVTPSAALPKDWALVLRDS